MCLAYKANVDIPTIFPSRPPISCPPAERIPAYILETLTEAGLD